MNAILLSTVLLFGTSTLAPQLAALPPAKQGGVYVVAHRGAHMGIPENTLAAYQKAIDLGCDFVEADIRTTKDGELVSIHNATVEAYAPGNTGTVKGMTLAELQALDIGSRVGPEWKEERIPKMDDVFALCKDKIGIYLDVKDADVDQLLAMARKHGMERQCLWYAGPKQLEHVAKHCPECLPMPDPGPEKLLAKMLARHRPRVVASVWKFYSESFVRTCHAAGAIVIVDEEDATSWEPALAWGTDGIQTDDPEGLIKLLRSRASKP